MKTTIHIATLCIVLACAAATAFASFTIRDRRLDLGDERIRFENSVGRLLEQQKYEELDALCETLRTSRERYSTGEWKLNGFYEGTYKGIRALNGRYLGRADEVLKDWNDSRPDSSAVDVAYAAYLWRTDWDGKKIFDTAGVHDAWSSAELKPFVDCWNELQAHRSKGRLDMEGYSVLLRYCRMLGKPRSEVDALIAEAARKEPDYHPVYVSAAFYLLPKWYGEAGDLEKFAAKAADDRGTTSGDAIYAAIANSLGMSYFLHRTKLSGTRVRDGFLALQDAFPGSHENLNLACRFACYTKDIETARKLFRRIQPHQNKLWTLCVWDDQAALERWRNWATNNGPFPGPNEIHDAAQSGDVKTLRRLIKEGANIDALTADGFTPLTVALHARQIDAAMLLVEAGANLTSATIHGSMPLSFACSTAHPGIVKAMIARNAPPGRNGDKHGTALHMAASNGSTEVVKMILEMPGIGVNDTNDFGFTAMHCAAEQNCPDVIAMLAAAGGNLNAKDHWQRTPLQIAVNYSGIEAVAALLKAGADVNPRNFKNNTPTNVARRTNQQEILDLLIQHGGID